jgi:outer membrane protein assembly factor BamB
VLTGDIAAAGVDAYEMQMMGLVQGYSSSQADSSMLATFVYRDLTSGLLGSDGEQVFVLEDNSGQMQQPNQYFGWGMVQEEDLYGRDWSTNRLVAYDIATGKRRWTVGGTKNNEVFDPHLAGTYFLGVPVCSGDELYVVAEQDRMIRLLALDSDTGQTLWSCELLSTGSSISQDVVRRLWACQPAVCGSVIVCPTGLGWVMGIDRWQHSIVWSHRLTPRNDGSSRNIYHQVVQAMQPLDQRWFMAPPIVAGHRVLITPIEIPDEFNIGNEPSLICLNAYTGELEWQQPRGEYLHLAAVVNELAVLVGPQVVAGLSVATGEPVWRADLDPESQPRGDGVVAGDRFLLPLSGGQLWSFDLATGAVVDQQTSVVEGDHIGNIAIHNGMLLSSSPQGLSGYPLENTLQSWIDERLAADPDDPEAALRMAEMAIVSGDYARALQLLPSADRWPAESGSTESEPQRRSRQLRRQLLVRIVEENLLDHDAEFAELASISQNDDERIEVLKIEADRAMARDQWSEALNVYQSLLGLAGDRMVFDGPVEIRLDRLVSARMEDLWTSATPDVQVAISQHLAGIVDAARSGSPEDRQRVIGLFGFHPSTNGLTAWNAEDAGDEGRLIDAELLWNRLRASDDPQVAANATRRYAELLRQYGLFDDIRQLAREIPAELGEAPVEANETLAQRINTLVADLPDPEWPMAWSVDTSSDWSIDLMSWQYYQQKQTLQVAGDLAPSMLDLEVSLLQNGNQRLQFFNAATNERWGTPIMTSLSGGRNYYSYWPGLLADGHAIYGIFQNVVSRISYFESDVAWATATESSNANQVQRYARGFTPSPLYPPAAFTQSGGARAMQANGGLMADANPFAVLCYGDDELILIDPLSGEIQWRLPGVPATTTACLFEKVIYLINDRGSVSFVVRTQDGRLLDSVDYVPSDEAQRTAFERFATTPVTDAEESVSPQRQRRVLARPIRVFPRMLPRRVNGLQAREGGGGDGAGEPVTRVVSHWGDGLFAIIADRFVRIDHDDQQVWLSAVEPETGEQAWLLMFPGQVRMTLTREQQLFVLSQADGRAWLVDLRDGTSSELAPAPEELRGNHTAYVVTDSRSIYLIVNHLENPLPSYGNLQSVQVHGTLLCWSRETGEVAWQRTIENRQLVLDSFEETPVLVLTSVQSVQKQVINYMESHVQLVDKQTGHVGLDDHWASMNGYINQFIVDPSRQYLELRGYNERVRMMPIVPTGSADSSD